MKIRLRRGWFAPDISGNTSKKYVGRNGRVLARGHQLRKGVHEVPDEWLKLLPSDAQVLEGPYELEEDEREYAPAKGGPSLVNQPRNVMLDTTTATAAATQLAQITEKAENDRAAQIKKARVDNLAKARDAKVAKQKEKNANA